MCACVFVSSHLSSTQADIELVEVLCSFGGEARTVHQQPHRPEEAEVKSQSGVALFVGEVTVTVTQTVVLSKKHKKQIQVYCCASLIIAKNE